MSRKSIRRASEARKRPNTTVVLGLESLERRDLMSLSKPWLDGSTLIAIANDISTSVEVRQSGSKLVIRDMDTGRKWSYAAKRVSQVQFQGGAGDDRFINYFSAMKVQAWGFAGNDYLVGGSGADYLNGGDGQDTLFGAGGNDRIVGGNGNDVLRGGDGNDELSGLEGSDLLEGQAGDDIAWGGAGNDVLLGGDGNDQLVGEDGNDRLNGQSGIDLMWGGNGDDVLISIDGALGEYLEGDAGADSFWVDRNGSSTDGIYGFASNDKLQDVAWFANGADRTLDGDSIADPAAKSGGVYRRFSGNPLFSTVGPAANDIRQGALGDCYYLAGLAAMALDSPNSLRQNIADFDDGTYGVRLGNSFYRVDSDLPVANGSSSYPAYAKLGQENSMWVAVAEKAFAHYRRGTNDYASIEGGWGEEANLAFGAVSAGRKSFASYGNATALANDLLSRWVNYQSVTLGFIPDSKRSVADPGDPLILGHAYTLVAVLRNSAGVVTSIVLRNPWGYDGAVSNDADKNDGLVTLTPAQIFKYTGAVSWGKV